MCVCLCCSYRHWLFHLKFLDRWTVGGGDCIPGSSCLLFYTYPHWRQSLRTWNSVCQCVCVIPGWGQSWKCWGPQTQTLCSACGWRSRPPDRSLPPSPARLNQSEPWTQSDPPATVKSEKKGKSYRKGAKEHSNWGSRTEKKNWSADAKPKLDHLELWNIYFFHHDMTVVIIYQHAEVTGILSATTGPDCSACLTCLR